MQLITQTSIAVIVILVFLQFTRQPMNEPDMLTGRRYHYSKVCLFALFFVLAFVSSFRQGFVDTGTYRGLCEMVGTDYANAFNDTIPIESGFSLFMIFLNRINPDTQFFIAVTSIIIVAIELRQYSKYAKDVSFTLLLYFLLSWMGSMNGIRQVMVASLLMLGIPWLLNRKTIPYLILVVLLSTFHTSVLVCIPLYFIISGKRLNWGIWLFAGVVIFILFVPSVSDYLIGTILQDSVYEEYLNNEERMGIMRLAVATVPVLLSLIFCHLARRDGRYVSRLTDVLINTQIVSYGFTVLGLKMLYYARVSMYFGFATLILLPITIEGCFPKRQAQVVKGLAVVLYFCFFVYQIHAYEVLGYMGNFHLIF